MIAWQIGIVTELIAQRDGMQEVRVKLSDGTSGRALHDLSIHEPLIAGDQVLLNTTAVRLNLGTGGYHFVHARLPESSFGASGCSHSLAEPATESGSAGERGHTDLFAECYTDRSNSRCRESGKAAHNGHMMKLKYTSLQRAVLAAEEPASPYHEVFINHQRIDGIPVLVGELHSMLPIAAAWLHYAKPQLRIAYVMSDGGALPISLSRHVSALKQLSWLCGTVTYGQAYGGDLETMNKFTALIAARHILRADIIIACMGPGIAGTGTPLGHTGTEAGELVNAAAMLGGRPILIPRLSGAEQRPRHYGLSHHLTANLKYTAACRAVLPLPAGLPDELTAVVRRQLKPILEEGRHRITWQDEPSLTDLEAALCAYPLTITTMGRTLRDDPSFYLGAASAAAYAAACCTGSANHGA
ncbi:hypothetical protein PRECH8_01070 [Insulibacter thermoxylanivorax]|uniref:DUF3866 domain-containing protein n=1 Tax=Insulibacter thermoxylanivorax TaxID=2749268 RepID=A0A916QE24_9BACL|nr:DUF3866 family protein [Insulibacter thermoxylanivorax]GFR36811.1 hypothetical protein PRECH8_01070 [Insulibacter thermoxylanivorax]